MHSNLNSFKDKIEYGEKMVFRVPLGPLVKISESQLSLEPLQEEKEKLVKRTVDLIQIFLNLNPSKLPKEIKNLKGNEISKEQVSNLPKDLQDAYQKFKEIGDSGKAGRILLNVYLQLNFPMNKNLNKEQDLINKATIRLNDIKSVADKVPKIGESIPIKEKTPEPNLPPFQSIDMKGRTEIPVTITAEEKTEIRKEINKRLTKLWEYLTAQITDRDSKKNIVGIDPDAPWKYYVGESWVSAVENLMNSLDEIYIRADAKLEAKKIINEECYSIFNKSWKDEKGQGTYAEFKTYIDNGRRILSEYNMALSVIAGATTATILDKKIQEAKTDLEEKIGASSPDAMMITSDSIIISNMIEQVRDNLNGPLERMFRLDENKRWEYDYALTNKINVNSPTAELEVLLSIAQNVEFESKKIALTSTLDKMQFNNIKYNSFSVKKAFLELPLQTQYQLIKFIDESGWKGIPDPEIFAEFVIGLRTLSPHSSAQFLKSHGKKSYQLFKAEDLAVILPFIGSRTWARELASQYDYLNKYIISLDSKLDFVAEYNAYKLRESKRKRDKSETISTPGGEELLDILKGSGAVDIRELLTLFEQINAIEKARIAGQPINYDLFPDIRLKEMLISTSHVKDFNQAYDQIFGPIIDIQVNAPAGEIKVPRIGFDLYALEDSEGHIPGEFNILDLSADFKTSYINTTDSTENVDMVLPKDQKEKSSGTIATSKSSASTLTLFPDLIFSYTGPGRMANVGSSGEINMSKDKTANKKIITGENSATTSENNYLAETVLGNFYLSEDIRNIPVGEKGKYGMIYKQILNFNWQGQNTKTMSEQLERIQNPDLSEKELKEYISEQKKTRERYATNFWLDHNDRGATTAVRLLFDQTTFEDSKKDSEITITSDPLAIAIDHEKTGEPKDILRKFEVEVFHRRPLGGFTYAGTFELTEAQAQQIYATHRQIIEKSKAGLVGGTSFQAGYSNLLLFDRDLFAEGSDKTTKYFMEGVSATTQVGKLGITGAFERTHNLTRDEMIDDQNLPSNQGKPDTRDKGLAIGSWNVNPRIIGAGMIYINPEFLELSNLINRSQNLHNTLNESTNQNQSQSEPQILRKTTASISDLSKIPDKGIAFEGIYIDNSNWYLSGYGGLTLTETDNAANTLRAGFLNKIVTDKLMWGVGGFGKTNLDKERKEYGGAVGAYVSNLTKTAFLSATLFAEKQYSWGGDLAAKYIGESFGAKAIVIGKNTNPLNATTIFEEQEANLYADKAVFAGADLTFKLNGEVDEIRLAYVGGMELRDTIDRTKKYQEGLKELQQHISEFDFGKSDTWGVNIAGAGAPKDKAIIGSGGVAKIKGLRLIDKEDFKFSGVVQGGAFYDGKGIGVEGTMVTAGLAIGIGKIYRDEKNIPSYALRLVLIPINWTMDTKTGKMTFEFASGNMRMDVEGGFIDGYFGVLAEPTFNSMLTDEEKQLKTTRRKLNLKMPYNINKTSYLASAGAGAGIKRGLNEYRSGLGARGGQNPTTDFAAGDVIFTWAKVGSLQLDLTGTIGYIREISVTTDGTIKAPVYQYASKINDKGTLFGEVWLKLKLLNF